MARCCKQLPVRGSFRGVGPSCTCRLGQSGIDQLLREHLQDLQCWTNEELTSWANTARSAML